MRRVAICLLLLLLGCSSTPSPSPSPSFSASAATDAGGVATDQPCTRSVETEGEVVAVPYELQDLEAMIPAPADVDGMVGFEDDLFVHGYHDNAELPSIVPNPPSTCDDLARFGRISGFGIGFARPDDPTHNVMFAVHLFGDEAAAKAWPDAFFGPMAAAAGTPDGPTSFSITQPAGLPEGTIVVEHVGGDGVRTWASTTHGRIVGWVIDLHPEGQPSVDIAAAVRSLVEHIEATPESAARGSPGPDAAHVLSVPLPQSTYGTRADGLSWDSFFGGCADAVERGMIAGDQARVDAERFGRVSGCTAMYAPAGAAAADGTVRLFSSISIYGDPEGATASIAALLDQNEARGGRRFEAPDLGDESFGQVTPVSGGDATYTDTRVMLRRGDAVGVVALHSSADDDASAQVGEWATSLDARMAEFLGR